MQSCIKTELNFGSRLNLNVRNQYHCLPRNFNGFPMYFAQCSFTDIKSTFIKLQNDPLPKGIGQVLVIVNNSV